MKRHPVKVLVMLLIFVIAGAIVNVAVAWVIAVTVRAPSNSGNPIAAGFRMEEGTSPLQESLDGWTTHRLVRRFGKPGTQLIVVTAVSNPPPQRREFADLLPSACSVEDVNDREDQARRAGQELGFFYWDGRGWPVIGLATWWPWFQQAQWPTPPVVAGLSFSSGKATAPAFGSAMPAPTGPWPYNVHDLGALPLCPVWPGFAINTIFYTAILWVMWFATGKVKRTLRRRRGLCEKCAYPIGTSPLCTECGNPLKVCKGMGLPPPATPATDAERTT